MVQSQEPAESRPRYYMDTGYLGNKLRGQEIRSRRVSKKSFVIKQERYVTD